MTGNSTTPGEKLRALFLAALMVLSVMAAGVAFSGTAAANASSLSGVGNQDTVGDEFTITVDLDNSNGETVTVEHTVDGEVKQNITATDGGQNDADGVSSADGSIDVVLTAGKTAGGTSSVEVTDESGNTLSESYSTSNYLVVTTPDNVTQDDTVTIEGDIYEYPGDLQDDATLDYTLVYEENATDSTEATNDIVLAESDTNSGEFSVQRTFGEVDDGFGEEHLNDYPSDAFDGDGEPAYNVYVDSASDSDGPAAIGNYGKETPSVENNEGTDTVEVRLTMTANPDQSPLEYADSADISGVVENANGGLDSYAVKLETPTGVTAKTTDTVNDGSGQYTYTAVFNDAGDWQFGTNEGGYIQYGTLTVESAVADVTLTNDSGNLANFPETYSATVEDTNGDAIPLNGSANNEYEGYVAFVGEFESASGGTLPATTNSGDIEGFTANTGNFLRAADTDSDGDYNQIHMETDANGEVGFDATPVGTEVVAQLQNDLGFNRSAGGGVDTTLDDIFGGAENYRDAGNTPDSPDYQGSDSNNVRNADPVNIIEPAVEDPQTGNPQTSGEFNVNDGDNNAVFTDILTDSGPAIVEVLPLADSTADRIVNGERLGFDGNKNLEGMTAYRVSFELRNLDNVNIAPGSSDGDFNSMEISGAGIDATIFNDSGNLAVDAREDNVLDAQYTDIDGDTEDEYTFLIRPTSTNVSDEQIVHTIQVNGEDTIELPLDAAGLDVEEFLVDGQEADAVRGDTTLNLTSVIQAPYDNDAPVNNGLVRLTQTGFTLNTETDARTANVNDGEYKFENVDIGPRGIDSGSDGIADDVSELVFTAYQYSDADSDQALEQPEVDRAAVETLPLAIDDSLQISYDAENTSVYSGFKPDPFGGQTFTLTKGVQYDQLAFELTTENGDPVDLTDGIDNTNVGLNDLAGETFDGENFVQIVGAAQDGNPETHEVLFDTAASDPSAGYYVIDDIETSPYISSADDVSGVGGTSAQAGGGLDDAPGADEVFAFNESTDNTIETFQLQITTPDISFKTNEDTQGYFNVEEPMVDTNITAVSTDDRATFTELDNVTEMTVGIDRWYRVNGTWSDALGTPINGSEFVNSNLEFQDTGAGSATFEVLETLGNSNYSISSGPGNNGLVLNNEDGEFQIEINPTSANSTGIFEPEVRAYAHDTTDDWWSQDSDGNFKQNGAFPEAFIPGTPTGQLPVVEVYDENGADLPVNPSNDSDNDVLANDVKNNLRVEAFQADPNDLDLVNPLQFGFPNTQPFAQNIVGTTTSQSQNVVTPGYSSGQLGFLAITPTGTGDGILTLIDRADGDGSAGTVVVDTNSNPILFDVLRSNLQVGLTAPSSAQPGDTVDVTLIQQSTGEAIESANVALVDPTGNVANESQTDQNGTTVLTVPSGASGTYTVETQPAGYQPASQDVSVAVGPQFEVNNLNPTDATVDRGDTVTVSADIANVGDQQGTTDVFLTITNSSGEVVNVSDTATVQSGSQTSVSFNADTSALDAGNYTHAISADGDTESGNLTVLATQPPTFEVSNLSAPSSATTGDTINVSADVTNTGDSGGTKVVEFRFGGNVLASQNLTLLSGQTDQVDFTIDTSGVTPGTYTHGVFTPDDNQTATINITGQADFQVSNLSAPSSAVQGDTVNVTADITNDGSVSGTQTVEFRFGGSVLATSTVSLNAGATQEVSFTADTSGVAPGNYTHGVFTADDNQTATIQILEPANISIAGVNSPANITQGDDLTVDVDVTNTGQAPGNASVSLEINGTNVSTGTGAADITFLIDTSGSMSGEINAVQNGLQDFTNTLESQGVNVRYAVGTFADQQPYNLRQTYTSNLSQTQSTVNAITTGGVTERSFDAINNSIDDLNERAGANEFFIVFTDEDSDTASVTPSAANLSARLDSEGVSLFAVTLPETQFGSADLSVGRVANTTADGQFFNLGEGNFSQKFENEISGAIASATAGQQVTLNASETKTVSLTINGSQTQNLAPGNYSVEVTVGDDNVTRNLTVETGAPTLPGAQGQAADPDNDGLFEDVDGDGSVNVFDAIALYNNRNSAAVQDNIGLFDFDGDSSVDVFDAIELYNTEV